MPAIHTLAAPTDFWKLLANDLRWSTVSALVGSDRKVQELVALLKQPPNLVSYHLARLREMRLVTERRSAADGRDVYYHLDMDRLRELYFAAGESLHPSLHEGSSPSEREASEESIIPNTRVLFLCTRNSARSQMAEGIMRRLGGNRVDAFSAGSEPWQIHPDAVRVMDAIGIDVSKQRSKHLNEYTGQSFDYVVTVCDKANESCPVFPGDPERIHWSFPDPAAIDDEDARCRAFEQTAQELKTRIHYLLGIIDHERRLAARPK